MIVSQLIHTQKGDFDVTVKVPLSLLEQAIQLGNARTEAQTRWQNRSSSKTQALQAGKSLTADQLGCVGELIARTLSFEADHVYFSELLNDGEKITKEEQRPDIVKDDFKVDIKTVEAFRNNIAIPARHIDKNAYNGLLCVSYDHSSAEARVFYLDLATCPKTFKKGEKVGGYTKSNYYLVPIPKRA